MASSEHVLRGDDGFTATIGVRGACITSIRAPDRHHVVAEITLRPPVAPSIEADRAYLGAVVGRYANRIAGARFQLDGREVALLANDGPNQLHGGPGGVSRVLWSVRHVSANAIDLRYRSAAGDQGYPGTVDLEVTYAVVGQRLRIDYRAVTDQPTVLCLSNHAYFDLSGHAGGHHILDHVLQIDASRYVAVDAALLPTGELRAVAGTPFDFRAAASIGARIDDDDAQLAHGRGYDHCWVLDAATGQLARVASLTDPGSGRRLEVETTEPGLQIYSGNMLDVAGPCGLHYRRRAGVCLETQHFPDSPNQPTFPPTVLRPGELYASTTVFSLAVVA